METLGQTIGIGPRGFERPRSTSRESDPKGLIGKIQEAAVSAANRVLSSLRLSHLKAVGMILGSRMVNIELIEEEQPLLPLPPARKERKPEMPFNNGYLFEPLPSAVSETSSMFSIASSQEVNPLKMEPLQPPLMMEQTVTPVVPIEAQVSMTDQVMIDPLPQAQGSMSVLHQYESVTPQFITPEIGQVIDTNVAPVAVEQTELAQFINIPEVSEEEDTQITAENDLSIIQEDPYQSFENYSLPTLMETFVNQTEPFAYEQIETAMTCAITEAVGSVISTMGMTQIGPDLSLASGLFGDNVAIGVDTPYSASDIGAFNAATLADSVSYQGSNNV